MTSLDSVPEVVSDAVDSATTQPEYWVLAVQIDQPVLERLGDARRLADRLGYAVGVLLVTSAGAEADVGALIAHGADRVQHVFVPNAGQRTRVAAAEELFRERRPRLVLAGGDCQDREWAALLAARMGWQLVSPALMVQVRDNRLHCTALDSTGRLAREASFAASTTVVATLAPGVAEAIPAHLTRSGAVSQPIIETRAEPVMSTQTVPADPRTVDIRFSKRIIAGGRGLGNKEGFDRLRRFADKLQASVAASRMAVDLGWIARDRQVGQTGKAVAPELYLACGISGASHHLEGISQAKHIVAINRDPQAPIFKVAHLGLVADLYAVLDCAEKALD